MVELAEYQNGTGYAAAVVAASTEAVVAPELTAAFRSVCHVMYINIQVFCELSNVIYHSTVNMHANCSRYGG